jgi:hypothetical protein
MIAWAVDPETYSETTVRRTLSTPAAGGRDTIEGYLTSTGGGALPMEFTPPQAVSAIRCRLISFQAESAHPFGGVRMRAVLEEVI